MLLRFRLPVPFPDPDGSCLAAPDPGLILNQCAQMGSRRQTQMVVHHFRSLGLRDTSQCVVGDIASYFGSPVDVVILINSVLKITG